jgi:serine/threonine-protein kinase
MPLQVGTRLGAYEIVSLLGAGGMGEVYRARDTRLDRTVALKILPASLASDAAFRERFTREGRAISQLDHPHICTLYDVGEQDGTLFLVMQFLEGETLETRLKKGAVPLDQSLQFAIQIADALDKAHHAGIVHRDLKPSNVMLTKSGAKLLDFGIAKAVLSPFSSSHPDPTNPRALDTMTAEGTLLGTVHYMAPEQLEGRDADARSDLFSFGALLYEMLTGKRAFDGESQANVIAAVLDHEPPAVSRLQPSVPQAVNRIVQKCLAKDPDRRWQSARDLSDGLSWAEETAPERSIPARQAWWSRAALAAASILLVGTAASAAWWTWKSHPEAPIVSRFSVALGEGQRFPPPVYPLVAVSPDGTQLVYPANNRLYRRAVSDLDAMPIPGTEEAGAVDHPIFSPDGGWIAYYSWPDRAIKKIAVTGGTAVTLCHVGQPFGISWTPAGILFGQGVNDTERGVLHISPDGGEPQRLIALEPDEAAASPWMLDSDSVLFTLLKGEVFDRWDKARIVVQSLKSGRRTTVIEGGSDGRYVPDGYIVFARGGVLHAIRFDARRLQTQGGAVPILAGVNRSGAAGIAAWSLAGNGTFAYVKGPAQSTDRRVLALTDRAGSLQRLEMPPAAYQAPRISPDGTMIAVGIDDETEANIWVFDVAGATPGRRLTYGGNARFPVWSHDGKRIMFQSDRDGDHGISWQLADGSGVPERLTKSEPDTRHVPESSSPDGDHLLFRVDRGPSKDSDTDSNRMLQVLSLKERRVAGFADRNGSFSAFSFDGRWVAYTARDGRAFLVYVQPFPATGAKYQIWSDGIQSVWSKRGLELFSLSRTQLQSVKITTRPAFTFSTPAPVRIGGVVGFGPTAQNIDTMPDGQHFLVLANPEGNDAAPEIQVVLNWPEDLTRRMPVK